MFLHDLNDLIESQCLSDEKVPNKVLKLNDAECAQDGFHEDAATVSGS